MTSADLPLLCVLAVSLLFVSGILILRLYSTHKPVRVMVGALVVLWAGMGAIVGLLIWSRRMVGSGSAALAHGSPSLIVGGLIFVGAVVLFAGMVKALRVATQGGDTKQAAETSRSSEN